MVETKTEFEEIDGYHFCKSLRRENGIDVFSICCCNIQDKIDEMMIQSDREAEESWLSFKKNDAEGKTITLTMKQASEMGLI